jgi:eukaryotic-like serine/threonine-protein kinase
MAKNVENRDRDLAPFTQQLIDELAESYRRGQPIAIDDLIARRHLHDDDPDLMIPIIYEELCLREEQGEQIDRDAFIARFPKWKLQLGELLECYDLLSEPGKAIRYPEIGEQLGDFQLIAELGRGAAGRVYLGKQTAMLDRYVALKVTPCIGSEHLSLARLQHSGIVPVYWMQEFSELGIRVLCMPFMGGVTLASAMETLRSISRSERSGMDIARILHEANVMDPESVSGSGPALQFLANATYEQAVCWIGACLADALHYAHERGLLHLDVKPSNVLMASDGQPMLLDFHLARESADADNQPIDWLGGTHGYMAPEQRLILESLQAGRSESTRLDRRSDIYALGVLLYELFRGQTPQADRTKHRSPTANNEIDNVIEQCLALDPIDRYASADKLANDLRKCLVAPLDTSIQLKNSRGVQIQRVMLVAFVAIAWVGSLWLMHLHNTTLHLSHLQAIQASANDTEVIQRLHSLVDQLRVSEGQESIQEDRMPKLMSQCSQVWERRTQLFEKWNGLATSQEKDAMRCDLVDLATSLTELKVRLSPKDQERQIHQDCIAVLEEAMQIFGPMAALYRRAEKHATLAGMHEIATEYATKSLQVSPKSAWEHYVLGKTWLAQRQWNNAFSELQSSAAVSPTDRWSHFFAGVAAYRLKRFQEAVVSFTVCIALDPARGEAYYHRGLVYQAMERPDLAQADLDQAANLQPK